MSRIRGQNTGPELIVRSLLHRLGFRFRLHAPDLPGRPDIVLPRFGTVVLVHGCFWHRHPRCSRATTPSSNVRFWKQKFADTVARDVRTTARLRRAGWRVLVVWECQIDRNPERCVSALAARIAKGNRTPTRPRRGAR